VPVVRVSDATFSDLKLMATWFGTKTPSETLDRAVRDMMDHLGLEREDQDSGGVSDDEGVMEFERTPGLSFTRVLSAKVNNKELPKSNWASVLASVVLEVKRKGYEGESLVRELQIPARNGLYEELGYKFDSKLGISIQGQSAPEAWKEISRLAQKWKIPVSIQIQWKDNPKAQFPGKVGLIRT